MGALFLGPLRHEAQAFHQLFAEAQIRGIFSVARQPGIDKLAAEELVGCQAAQ